MIPDLIFNAIDFLGSHTFACCDLPAMCPAAGAGQEPAASGGMEPPQAAVWKQPGGGRQLREPQAVSHTAPGIIPLLGISCTDNYYPPNFIAQYCDR